MKYLLIIILLFCLFSCGSKNPSPAPEERVPVTVVHPQTADLTQTISSSGMISSVEDLTLSFKVGGMVQQTYVEEGDNVTAGELLAKLNTTELDEQLRQSNLTIEKLTRDESRLQALVKDTVATLEELQNTQTALQTAQSQKQTVAYNIRQSMLYAPENGIVISKQINAGEFKQPGSPAYIIGNNTNHHKWIFRIALSDKDRVTLTLHQTTHIVFDALPGKTFSGSVVKLDNVPDAATGTYNCYVALADSDDRLVYGLSGHLVTEISSHQNDGAVLPMEALLNLNSDSAWVYVLQADSTVRRQVVHINSIKEGKVSVADSLPPSASIITAGKTYLNDGSKVKIEPQ